MPKKTIKTIQNIENTDTNNMIQSISSTTSTTSKNKKKLNSAPPIKTYYVNNVNNANNDNNINSVNIDNHSSETVDDKFLSFYCEKIINVENNVSDQQSDSDGDSDSDGNGNGEDNVKDNVKDNIEDNVDYDGEKNDENTMAEYTYELTADMTSTTQKKRGRKPKPKAEVDEEIVEEKIQKKRGRKPKVKENNETEETEESKTPKKRGRKPKEKVYSVKEYSKTFVEDKNETLILHLPIKTSDIINDNNPIASNSIINCEYSLINDNNDFLLASIPENYNINNTNNTNNTNNPNNNENFDENTEETNNDENSIGITTGEKKIDQNISLLLSNSNIFEKNNNNLRNYDKFDKFDKFESVEKSGISLSFGNSAISSNHLNRKTNDITNDILNNTISNNTHALFNNDMIIKNNSMNTQLHNNLHNNSHNNLHNNSHNNSHNNLHNNSESIYDDNKVIKKNIKNIMYEFINANDNMTWPESTNIYCWWCCSAFDNIPCSLPENYKDDKFYVYGCFCTFNCAASYNFNKNDDRMYERYSLLNLMYKKMNNKKITKITLAPPRETLKIFGGYLTIEEFREYNLKNEKTFNLIKPPLISIIPKIEENISLNKNTKTQIVNENILNKTQSNLKLKRNKPVINPNNTLQTFMDLKIIN